MKKFKVTMVATAIKEIFVSAKDKNSAMEKVEKCYLDEEKLDFTEDDITAIREAMTQKGAAQTQADNKSDEEILNELKHEASQVKKTIDKYLEVSFTSFSSMPLFIQICPFFISLKSFFVSSLCG